MYKTETNANFFPAKDSKVSSIHKKILRMYTIFRAYNKLFLRIKDFENYTYKMNEGFLGSRIKLK